MSKYLDLSADVAMQEECKNTEIFIFFKKTCSCDSSKTVEGNPMSLGKKTLHPKRKSQQILYPKTDLQNQNMNQSRGNQRL